MLKETIQGLQKMQRDLQIKYVATIKELKSIEQEMKLVENIIKLKKGKIGLSKEEIPEKYDNELFQDKKVIFVIKTLQAASVKEIADYMHKKEKGSDYKSIYARAQQVVIKLTKENKIIKIGNYASKYKLNMIE